MQADQDTAHRLEERDDKRAGSRLPAVGFRTGREARPWIVWGSIALLASVLLSPAASRSPETPARPPSAGPAQASLPLPGPDARRPTFLLFQSAASRLERHFRDGLRREGPGRGRSDLRVVLLSSLDSPVARRFRIRETPTLLTLAPGGREISRWVGPQGITAALAASVPGVTGNAGAPVATCAVWKGPRLRWVEENDPRARRVYRRFGAGRWHVPDIFKAMSLRPELMEKALDLSEMGHFSDGYLDRRTKERIATYVSALNRSHYCLGSHAGGLRDLGASSPQVAALARGDLAAARLAPREQALLQFVRRLTLAPGEITDADVARLQEAGWRDEQIFEAAFDAALFAFFNRLAITYGLDYPPDGWNPSASPAALYPPE